jgi:hypothetical protein
MKIKKLVADESVSRILILSSQTNNFYRINAKNYIYNICGRVFVTEG